MIDEELITSCLFVFGVFGFLFLALGGFGQLGNFSECQEVSIGICLLLRLSVETSENIKQDDFFPYDDQVSNTPNFTR